MPRRELKKLPPLHPPTRARARASSFASVPRSRSNESRSQEITACTYSWMDYRDGYPAARFFDFAEDEDKMMAELRHE